MRSPKAPPIRPLLWLALGVVSAVVLAWASPRAYPTLPEPWEINLREAEAIALERFRTLGEPVEDPYIETILSTDELLERRLGHVRQASADEAERQRVADHWIASTVFFWQVTVYRPDAASDEWTYRAKISPDGTPASLLLSIPKDESGGEIDATVVRERAGRLLSEQGFDLTAFEEPELRSTQLESRTDWVVRYREKDEVLGEGIPYGLEVRFAGDRLTGYSSWYDDPDEEDFLAGFQGLVFAQFFWRLAPLLLIPVVGFFFLRRYHAGEVGVRRGTQIFLLSGGLSLLLIAFAARGMAAGWIFGILTRSQTTLAAVGQILVGYFLPVALLSALAWTVGEALCREHAPYRLAAFDALARGRWTNATVARASLVGAAAGIATAAAVVGLSIAFEPFGLMPISAFLPGPWWSNVHWMAIPFIAFSLLLALFNELFARLLLTSAVVRKFGSKLGGALAALAGAVVLFPPVIFLPWPASVPFWVLVGAIQVVLFLRYGIATALMSALIFNSLLSLYPFLGAADAWLQVQAWIPLVVFALPLLVSVRHLVTGEEVTYLWDDVPSHVRRITERERQRVELETARRIQSSILPDLPPQLNGVELAHAYLPASEVGGDFYDVLALEDGRLALAVGDVAGHGVSSGLVMSMARSALAVQTTFDPAVASVFATLNRVVYQSARKRLLATLCYAILDPVKRELTYASAGHLYPYLIKTDGRIYPLEFDSYPLGVRAHLDVEERLARLDSGDTLFLLSDGLVEARPMDSDDLYGFERLEESLKRNAHLGVSRLRDAVLADVDMHSQGNPREDDQTVLVLRVP